MFRCSSILWLAALACSSAPPPVSAPTPPPAPAPAPEPAQPGPVALKAGDLAISHVHVVAMTDAPALDDQTVIVRGDRILAIAPSAAFGKLPAGVVEHDGKQAYLMPGLTDMHVHVFGDNDLTLLLAAGVTTVRNMFGSDETLVTRDKIAKGALQGPTILTAGPIIDGNPPVWPGSDVLSDPAAADALVARQKQAGYDFLKPYSRLSKPAYEALAAAGAKYGMALEGHVPDAVGLRGVLAAKQKSVEHMDGWLVALVPDKIKLPADRKAKTQLALAKADDARLPELIAKTKDAGTWNCPTLVVFDRIGQLDDLDTLKRRVGWLPLVPRAMVSMWDPKLDFRLKSFKAEDYKRTRDAAARNARILKAITEAGAPILVGTDTGNPFVVPGAALHDEIELMVAAGIPRARVMRAATADAAVFAGTPHEFGVIEPGARADLLLVPSDPMAGPIPLIPDAVIARGTWHTAAELQRKLDAIAAQIAAPPKDFWKDVPPLAVTGKPPQAIYDLEFSGHKFGEERIAMTGAAGQRTIAAQASVDMQARGLVTYRLTPDATAYAFELGQTKLALDGKLDGSKLVATGSDLKGAPISLSEPIAKGAFLTLAGAAGSLVLADKLTGMAVGGKRELHAVELNALPAPGIYAVRYVVERKPDAGGNRVYGVTSSVGGGTSSGDLVVDAQGQVVSQAYGPPLNLTIRRH